MDIYTIIVMGHVIGTILGTGGATIAELQIVRALRDKKISADESALMHVNYSMIRVGMGMILISVIAMFWYFAEQGNDFLFTSDKFLIKDLMLVMIILNAIALHKRWTPLWLGASTSFVSWWGATLLGLAGQLPYSFTTYLIGYVVAIFAFAGISRALQYAGRKGYLTKKNIALSSILIVTALLIILFTTYRIFKTDYPTTYENTPSEEAVGSRELSSIVSYDIPEGSHIIEFTITIDDDGIIQKVSGLDLTAPEKQSSIDKFSATLTTTIQGKKLSELEAVDKVGTSSLTTNAFNESLTNIKAQL